MNFKIENIEKYYGDLKVLDNISLEINGVSTIGIIGESGCGKSTLLRLLAGIEDTHSGSILINDLSPMIDRKNFQSQIGYVFQKHNLFPHLTIRENIALILEKIKHIDHSTAEEKIQTVLKKLRIEDQGDKKPSQVSGGQAQRGSIARALATDPQLIFLDEPTAALDPILTREVLKSVQELKNTGIEFIFVTHEIQFLKDFADYVIFMDKGVIVEHGTPIILNNPQSQKLKEFLDIG